MELFTIDLKLIVKYSYVGTYNYLNESEYVGYAIPIKSKQYEDVDGNITCYNLLAINNIDYDNMKLDPKYLTKVTSKKDLIVQGIKGAMTRSGCHHESDCCGCPSVRVIKVRKINDNLYGVMTRVTFNL